MTIIAYIDKDGNRLSLNEVRSRVNAAYGETLPKELQDIYDLKPLISTTPPAIDPSTQYYEETSPILNQNQYIQQWQVIDLPVSPDIIDTSNFVPTYLLRQRAQNAGIWDDLSAYLVQYPALMLKVLTLEAGVDPKDPDLLAGFNTLNVPQSVQDYLLSDPSLGV